MRQQFASLGRHISRAIAIAEIADALGATRDTVRTTLKHLYVRLGISRQVELTQLVGKAAGFAWTGDVTTESPAHRR